jgi:transposase
MQAESSPSVLLLLCQNSADLQLSDHVLADDSPARRFSIWFFLMCASLSRSRLLLRGLAIAAVPGILDEADNGLTDLTRALLRELYQRIRTLDEPITAYDTRIAQFCAQQDTCQRLTQVPGVGPLIATAFFAAIRDAHAFQNGRQVAAWLGLVPK